MSLTTDIWTSLNTSSFMAITAHFWNEDKKILDSCILECMRLQGSHSIEALGEELQQIATQFSLSEKLLAIVTDVGSNVVEAVWKLEWKHLYCYAHFLNLVVSDSIKASPNLLEIKEQVRAIITLTRQSTKARDKLQDFEQKLGSKQPKKLKQDIKTRWNSTFKMFERLLILRQSVALLLDQPEAENIGL